MKLKNKIKRAAAAVRSSTSSTSASECSTFQDCLEQAEICSDQARQAARMRRYKAARGLFSTASQLYRRAIELAGGALPEALERLHQIDVEAAAYTELDRSMARPLMSKTHRTAAAAPPGAAPAIRSA